MVCRWCMFFLMRFSSIKHRFIKTVIFSEKWKTKNHIIFSYVGWKMYNEHRSIPEILNYDNIIKLELKIYIHKLYRFIPRMSVAINTLFIIRNLAHIVTFSMLSHFLRIYLRIAWMWNTDCCEVIVLNIATSWYNLFNIWKCDSNKGLNYNSGSLFHETIRVYVADNNHNYIFFLWWYPISTPSNELSQHNHDSRSHKIVI